jgi:predicted aspartyl protease
MRRYFNSITQLTIFIIGILVPLCVVAQQPESGAPNIRFASGKSALKIPFELYDNVIFIKAQINNSQRLSFILDTGAAISIIDARLAEELKLKSQNKVKASGTGGSVGGSLIEGITISLSGAEVLNQRIAALPLNSLSPHIGHTIDGIIGYDFIQQFVIEIDYTAKAISLFAPDAFKYSGSGEIIPIKIHEGRAFMPLKIGLAGHDLIEGEFEIDTGSNGAVSINKPFVEANKLLQILPKSNSTFNDAGIGGSSTLVNARIKEIQIGRFVIKSLIADLSLESEGENANSGYAGLIGTEVFRRFKVILDYAHSRIILEPNKFFAEPQEADMSGIDLIAESDSFRVFKIDSVKANSPAAEAGLRKGDIITAINNRPAAEFNLYQISQLFMKAGQEYALSIQRGNQALQTKIKLRRLI